MIKLNSVSKEYPGKKAVDDVSFQAKEGEVIGFLGPNGAGKTTTMRLILGYLTPTEGEITVDKQNPMQERISVLKKVGYLPENNPLYYDMKVQEYLEFIKEVKKADVGLDDRLTNRIEHLSRGYKQRVGLAAALLGDPKIFILDEPTSGLDPLEQDKIRDLIKKRAKHKTTIFSTHILSEVEEIATRLVIINKGKIVYDDKKPAGKGEVEKLFKKLVK
jgi:ABC-2 type transport system ATP-binding protein